MTQTQEGHREVPIYIFYAIGADGGTFLLEPYATEEAARRRARLYVNLTYEQRLSDWLLEYDEAVEYAWTAHRLQVGVSQKFLCIY
jgi:hypothetical protein